MWRSLLAIVVFAGCDSVEDCGPIAEECESQAGAQGCPLTLTAAQDPTSWNCTAGGMITVQDCDDGYHVAIRAFVDTGYSFYYDRAGSLYMIERWGIGVRDCEAGVSGPRPRCGYGGYMYITPAGPGCSTP